MLFRSVQSIYYYFIVSNICTYCNTKFHAEIVFPGHALLRVLLSCMSPPQYKTRQKTLSPDSQFSHHTKPNKRLFSWANRIIAIFSAQPNALKRWQRAYYRAFLRFLPGLWADSRRSFPRTQLAFSIWVPSPLLHPYSQNTYSRHRNPSNLHYIRASRITAALYAQSPECLIAKRGATSHARPDT